MIFLSMFQVHDGRSPREPYAGELSREIAADRQERHRDPAGNPRTPLAPRTAALGTAAAPAAGAPCGEPALRAPGPPGTCGGRAPASRYLQQVGTWG